MSERAVGAQGWAGNVSTNTWFGSTVSHEEFVPFDNGSRKIGHRQLIITIE